MIYAAESIQHANEIAAIPMEGSFHTIVKSTRLAIVGNDLLNSILSTMWYNFRNNQGNRLSTAEWTRIEQDLVSNNSLGRRGFELGLDRCIITAPGLERVSTNMMATTVEAILGAVYVDSGANDLGAVRAAVQAMGLHRHYLLVTFTNTLFPLL
jgi:ribonuclease-3